jgi:hypothetical protein
MPLFEYNVIMRTIIESVAKSLWQQLGGQLDALYLFGSLAQGSYQPGESDTNLLLIVTDDANVHDLRDIFRPIWQEHGPKLRRAPMVARRDSFRRHMQLNPLMGQHLAQVAEQLAGESHLLDNLPTPDPREDFTQIAFETMQASVALAPEMIEPEATTTSIARLRQLARRLSGQAVESDKPAALLLAEIHHSLNTMLEESPHLARWVSPKRPTNSLLLPQLEGAFKELGQLVMSFSVLSPHQIISTDWQQLSQQLAKHYTGLKITTSTQLRLIAELQSPLAYMFQRFEHEWGVNVLQNVDAVPARIMRDAARKPSRILVDSLPNAYLTQGDDQLGDLIHDFQNKMLNIQLEHELLHRMQQIERFTPPEPLPDRAAPSKFRVEAIFKQLNWWASYYSDQLMKYGV